MNQKQTNLNNERRAFAQFQRQQERTWQARVYQLLRRQMERVLKDVRTNGIIHAGANLDVLIQKNEFSALLRALYISVGGKAAGDQYNAFQGWIKADGGKNELPDRQKLFGLSETWRLLLSGYFDVFGAEKVVRIDNTTKAWLKKKLDEAQIKGLDYYALADSMRSDDINFRRGKVIARTETVGAAGMGRMAAARQSKILMRKRWLNSRDKRVREQHRDAPVGVGGEIKGMEEVFSNGLQQPGDPTGPAKQVIQCRCTVVFEPVRDERGRLIRI